MRISEQSWLEYIRRLARLNERAGQELAGYLARHGAADADAITAYAYALVQKYAEGSAELACQMYDAVAGAAGLQLPPAEPAAPAGYGEVAKLVRGVNGSGPLLQGGVQRLVKRAGADTTLQNALRDGAEFAWVPHGDTCPFCIALASRGWQRISKKALKNGHAEHIHANCDCEYAVRFDGKSSVAGYDPEKHLAQYNAAGGDLNAMRRARYAQDRDKINAQKRAAYAARKLRNAGVGGILNENTDYYIPITEQSIEAIQPFECSVLDKEGQKALAEAHKQLLRTASGQPLGVEVSRCYGLDGAPLGDAIMGEAGRVRIQDPDVPYIAAHTHPSGLTFSPGDILNFANHSNMRMLTAVGNNGTVYAVEKLQDFQKSGVFAIFAKAEETLSKAENVQQLVESMEKLLREAERYGISYHTGTNSRA